MTTGRSFPDRVRVSHTNDRYFRLDGACEAQGEDPAAPHGAFRAGARRTHARRRGRFVRCWARSRRVRAPRGCPVRVPERAPDKPQTWLNRYVRVPLANCASKASPRMSRPGTRADRVRWPLDSTTAMQERSICEAGAALPLFQAAVAPGDHAARASARRCPPLDARATAPGGVRSSSQKQTPCRLSRSWTPAQRVAKLPRGRNGRGAPLPLGRGPPVPTDELGLPRRHHYTNSKVAVGARRDHDQETTHKRNGAQGRRACLHRSITMQTHQRRARAHKPNSERF